MKIACVYTVETFNTVRKPFSAATEIPFGISIILTVLEKAGHEVKLFVITPETPLNEYIAPYIDQEDPLLFCFTAVSTQYWQAKKVAKYVQEYRSGIFTILGGHHASLNSVEVIKEGIFDAICIGEGEVSIVKLADHIESLKKNQNFDRKYWINTLTKKELERDDAIELQTIQFVGSHLLKASLNHITFENIWFLHKPSGGVKKNKTAEFQGELDKLPLINRNVWDEWIERPDQYPAILLGRGCPFKCTYCSNHAMANLSSGTYVRFRSPENIVSELAKLRKEYPTLERVYLEVETFGANRKASYAVFNALAQYNSTLEKPLSFGINLALTSNFMDSEERLHELLVNVKSANITTINVGLESGSERMRKDILLRPKYTNVELIRFCNTAKSYGIKIIYFVLIGLPGETIKDYMETVRVARESQPYTCYVSIFFPYLGTDLANMAIHMGLIESSNLSPIGERSTATLSLEGFSSKRIRFEYIIFWWRVYRGYWPLSKILMSVLASFLRGYPKFYSIYLFIRNHSEWVMKFVSRYSATERLALTKAPRAIGTRVDVISD